MVGSSTVAVTGKGACGLCAASVVAQTRKTTNALATLAAAVITRLQKGCDRNRRTGSGRHLQSLPQQSRCERRQRDCPDNSDCSCVPVRLVIEPLNRMGNQVAAQPAVPSSRDGDLRNLAARNGTEGEPLPELRGIPKQELMRHADMRTTTNVYGEAMDASKREARSKVVRMVSGSRVA